MKIYDKTLEEIKEYITPIIMEAGEKALQIREEGLNAEEKTKNDYVTQADKEVEEFLTYSFFRYLPQAKVMAEEFAFDMDAPKSEYMWVIDPIDGTINFMNDVENYWAISVALVKTNKENLLDPVLGIVYQPESQTVFYAYKGKGAYVWEEVPDTLTELKVNKTPLNRGLVCVGFNRGKEDTHTISKFIDRITDSVSGIRRMGAASMDTCNLAKGMFVGYVEPTLKPWDIAAASLILQEAGGKITDAAGEPLKLQATSCVASNGLVHKELLEFLK